MTLAYCERPDAEEWLALEIPGTPIPKGRPRLASSGAVYTPKKTRSYETQVTLLAREKMRGRAPFSGPIEINITARFTPPASWPKWKRNRVTDHGTFISMTVKPDVDNLAKIIDGLNGVVWHDDAQITSLEISKCYALKPSLSIFVRHRRLDIHSKTERKP